MADGLGISGVKMSHGPEATVASVGVQAFADDAALVTQSRGLGRKLRAALHPA